MPLAVTRLQEKLIEFAGFIQTVLLDELFPEGISDPMPSLPDLDLDNFSHTHPIQYNRVILFSFAQHLSELTLLYPNFPIFIGNSILYFRDNMGIVLSWAHVNETHYNMINCYMGSTPSSEISYTHQFSYRPIKEWRTEDISLKVVFFDYGVCASPFEYETQDDDGNISPELLELESIFLQEYQNELSSSFDPNYKWNIGKLDAYLKRGRYTPLYYDNIGVINNKFFMNRTQFQKAWQEAFDVAIFNFLTEEDLKKEEIMKQKSNLLQMDWIHFRTFVVYAYRDEKLSFDEIVSKKVATKYLLFMKQKFQSKVINEKYKIEKLLRRLNKFEVDIFFLQDIDRKILTYIEKKIKSFRVVRCKLSKSAILISEKAIGKIVGDSIRPLSHYNRKYLNSEQVYELSSQSNSTSIEFNYNNSFEESRQHRNFQFAPPMKKKKTGDLQSRNSVIEVKAKGQSPVKKEAAPKGSNEEIQLNQSSALLKNQESEQTATMTNKKKQQDKQELEINTFIPPELFKGLFWNDSTIVQFLSNVILITSCLDLDTDPEQEKYMLDSLAGLRQTFPKHTIIAAININKDIESIPGFEIYPNLKEKKIPTVYKRKTLIQSKIHKAKKLINSTEDYLFSTLPFQEPQVIDINHNQMGESPKLTPNQNHPYDHYIISAVVSCRVTKKVLKQ